MSAICFEAAGGLIAKARRSPAPALARHGAARLIAGFYRWRRRAGDRAELARLDDRMLADIGISRAEAEFLANQAFWRE